MLLGIVFGVVLLSVAISIRRPLHVPAAPRVLVFDVPGRVDEGPAPSSPSLDFLRRQRPQFYELLLGVRDAAEDRSVAGLVLHVDGIDWGWARVYEMRDAIQAFRAAGKPVYASLNGGGEKEYLLASAADHVVMPPVSTLQLDGLAASALFLHGTYDKLGIRANFVHVGRYKSAVEQYTRDSLSTDARVSLEALLDDQFALLVRSLADSRGLPQDSVRHLIDEGPWTSREAFQRGLLDTLMAQPDLDSLASHDELLRHPTASFLRYVEEGSTGGGERIALVVAEGDIVDGRSREGLFGERSVGDRTLVDALRDIRARRSIRAVVLRIDSPGGSGDASDAVWQELRRLRREKPVIVSMGDVAASGGYYLACAGDAIVAGPATITGSIGVYGGKLNILGLFRKLGMNVETVRRGRHADMWSPYRDFDAEERARYERSLLEFYHVFLSRVSEGRGMSEGTVDSVGQGRVWSGLAAHQRGLVDSLGGLHEALELARERAHIGADQDMVIEVYPRPLRSFLQRWLGGMFETPQPDEARIPALAELDRWYRLAGTPAGALLALMPYTIEID
jgi:protease-4